MIKSEGEFKGLKKTQSKKSKKKNQSYEAYDFIFPNKLDSRTETCNSNIVWQVDFTHLKTSLEGQENTSHYLLVILDPFNNNIVCSKVFLLKQKRGTITSRKLIKILEQTISTQNLSEALILHSDRGPEFTSREYFEFVNSHPFLVGSHSLSGNPTHNAVVERINRTLKTQTKKHIIPNVVSRTRDLQRIIDIKVKYLNTEFLHKKNNGNTAIELDYKQKLSNEVQPDILLARRETTEPFSAAYTDITKYRKTVSESVINFLSEDAHKYHFAVSQSTNQIAASGYQRLIEIEGTLDALKESIQIIHQNTAPKTKVNHKAQIERDPLPQTVYESIMNAEKPSGANRLNWSRFRIASTVLFYTGLRVNEIRHMTKEMLEDLHTKQKCSFYQSKQNTQRAVLVSDHALSSFSKLKSDIDIVYRKHDKLYPIEKKGSHKFTSLINDHLEPFAIEAKLTLKSHSFRINYVTELLKHDVPTHQVQAMIGHKDVRSTMQYSKYELTEANKMANLNKSFKKPLFDNEDKSLDEKP